MDVIKPNAQVFLRVASGQTKIVTVKPNTTISLGRFGSFPANSLIGRPYYLTWDVLDSPEIGLKLVTVEEVIREQTQAPVAPAPTVDKKDNGDEVVDEGAPSGLDLEDSAVGVEVTESGGEDVTVVLNDEESMEVDKNGGEEYAEGYLRDWHKDNKNNKNIVDDQTAQTMTAAEIEELKKKGGTDGGREIISKLLSSHVHIDKKTSFSLAKYTLRKTQKYLKRITVLPVDVQTYTGHLLAEKEPLKIMELRDESIGMMMSLADIKWGGRWLVIDEIGGLIVAAVAERMGLLNADAEKAAAAAASTGVERKRKREYSDASAPSKKLETEDPQQQQQQEQKTEEANVSSTQVPPADANANEGTNKNVPHERPPRQYKPRQPYEVPTSNTITLLHPLDQPNLSQLRTFDCDFSSPASSHSHPLAHHLLPLTYLQLLSPDLDPFLNPPPEHKSDEELRTWKSNKRNSHLKRYRRWEKQMKIVESTRKGGFDGVVIASGMELSGVLNAVVPLVRGSGQIVIYNPHVENLAEVADWCSTLRRSELQRRRQAANAARLEKAKEAATTTDVNAADSSTAPTNGTENNEGEAPKDGTTAAEGTITIGNFTFPPLEMHKSSEDFPIDPLLLLAPTIHTSRMRRFQALPGRTHPLMTSRGGSEGYILHATRVLPVVDTAVHAMGTRIKPRRKKRATVEDEKDGGDKTEDNDDGIEGDEDEELDEEEDEEEEDAMVVDS